MKTGFIRLFNLNDQSRFNLSISVSYEDNIPFSPKYFINSCLDSSTLSEVLLSFSLLYKYNK